MMQVKVQTLTGKHLAFEVCGQWVQGLPPPNRLWVRSLQVV